MSLSKLYCEGEDQGFDVRMLSYVLRGAQPGLVVEPWGGKESLPKAVISDRRRGLASAAICDGDFSRTEHMVTPPDGVMVWRTKMGSVEHDIGWIWRRKEIENYLLDVEVLSAALQWSAEQRARYEAVLQAAFERLSGCTAGRMALTICAPRKRRLETSLPLGLEEANLRGQLLERASNYNDEATIDSVRLGETFDRLLPRCKPGGDLFQRAAERFAGKDLLASLQQLPGISSIDKRLKSRASIEDAVIEGMDRAGPAVIDWLPEWRSLHDAVAAWSPPTA